MKTQIYKNHREFSQRENKNENGVSEEFAQENPEFESENLTNKGCWNCSGCSGCSGCRNCSDCSDCSGCSGCRNCSDCSDCSGCSGCRNCSDCSGCSGCRNCSDCGGCTGCSGEFNIPKINDLNKKVAEAVSGENSLDMSSWHTCKTTHCWAGWIVHLAGEEGKQLEEKTSTPFAAMMIFKESNNGESISPVNFYLSSEDALKKINELADKE